MKFAFHTDTLIAAIPKPYTVLDYCVAILWMKRNVIISEFGHLINQVYVGLDDYIMKRFKAIKDVLVPY